MLYLPSTGKRMQKILDSEIYVKKKLHEVEEREIFRLNWSILCKIQYLVFSNWYTRHSFLMHCAKHLLRNSTC